MLRQTQPEVECRGIYVTAHALIAAPNFARKLVEEHGVTLFIVRTGFDPASLEGRMDAVMELAHELKVKVHFLVGTWWGEGLPNAKNAMRPASKHVCTPQGMSHEAKWPMVAPGGDNDILVCTAVSHLCERYTPDGICLTHARFHHAADLVGLFEVADGEFGQAMADAQITPDALDTVSLHFISALTQSTTKDLLRRAEGRDLIAFVCDLSGSDLFEQWIDFRCRQVAKSLDFIFASSRARHPEMSFGSNAMGPCFSRLSGQNYAMLAEVCDFIQPLLCYMRWHVLQPIYAWSSFFGQHCREADPAAMNSLAARLFNLDPISLRLHMQDAFAMDEGEETAVIAMVNRQVDAIPAKLSSSIQPVLNGREPGGDTFLENAGLINRRFERVLYQGVDLFAGPSPIAGWS